MVLWRRPTIKQCSKETKESRLHVGRATPSLNEVIHFSSAEVGRRGVLNGGRSDISLCGISGCSEESFHYILETFVLL